MKKMYTLFSTISLLILSVWLVACGEQAHTMNMNMNPTALTLSFIPAKSVPMPGMPFILQASVKAGSQPVTNANVEFEVWKKESTHHDMLSAKMSAPGIYTASATYNDAGDYEYIVHCTTPQVHQMIAGIFTVGKR